VGVDYVLCYVGSGLGYRHTCDYGKTNDSKEEGLMAKKKKESPKKKYADGTTYKDSSGKTRRRVSSPGTKRGDAYCARTVSQKRTPKVKVRRKAWGCKGQKSVG